MPKLFILKSLLLLSFLNLQSCKEQKKIIPRPDNQLIGYLRFADEFLVLKDTSLTGIQVNVDQFQTFSDSLGVFRMNLGTNTLIRNLKCTPSGLVAAEVPWSNVRLRYSGDFSELAFMVDTFVYAPPSTTRCDSVGFKVEIDSLLKKNYTFTAYLSYPGDFAERGADLIFGKNPTDVLQATWGGLLYQRTPLGHAEFKFIDSVYIRQDLVFRSGELVYFSASGTSANNGNQPFWNVTSQNKAGAFLKHPFKTPVKFIVLP